MSEIIIALGLLFVIEGLLFSLAPGSVQNMAREVLNIPEQTLRTIGVVAMVLGVLIVWFVKG